ncbi:MAG TPA: hypothetical protein VFW19_08480 [Allosphingosinicella sp.]|nr:hypothetical protein [Allosphingosinicella sp.]
MSKALSTIHTQALDFWMARAAVITIVVLQLLLVNQVTLGPPWLTPVIELALLVPLSVVTAWAQDQVVRATHEHHWHMIARRRRLIRWLAVILTGMITFLNLGSLIMVVSALLGGQPGNNGRTLLFDAVIIWAINIIAFALWYWDIDRGGPSGRGVARKCVIDFLFPQMTIEHHPDEQLWSPGFIDYFYVAFTNATAFSPTDTLPLTRRAKMLMMIQSLISLMTIALVAARAVNILS